jgi:hypothetical protein
MPYEVLTTILYENSALMSALTPHTINMFSVNKPFHFCARSFKVVSFPDFSHYPFHISFNLGGIGLQSFYLYDFTTASAAVAAFSLASLALSLVSRTKS